MSARVVACIGVRKPHQPARIHVLLHTAWCPPCRAYRVLKNVARWAGWPKGEAPVSGRCATCGYLVGIDSKAPRPVA